MVENVRDEKEILMSNIWRNRVNEAYNHNILPETIDKENDDFLSPSVSSNNWEYAVMGLEVITPTFILRKNAIVQYL